MRIRRWATEWQKKRGGEWLRAMTRHETKDAAQIEADRVLRRLRKDGHKAPSVRVVDAAAEGETR